MSRDAVLGAVRRALGRTADAADPEEAAWAFPTTAAPTDLVAWFVEEARAVTTEVVDARGDHVSAVRDAVAGAEAAFVGPGVDAAALGLPTVEAPDAAARPDAVVGIAWARAGLAESGTCLVDADGAHLPTLLTETSILLLRKTDIVPGLEQLEWDPAARAAILVTGPSRTADIEKKIVLGAHGPRRLVVVLV